MKRSAPRPLPAEIIIEAGARALTTQYGGHPETVRHVRACAVLLRALLSDDDTRRPSVVDEAHPKVPF